MKKLQKCDILTKLFGDVLPPSMAILPPPESLVSELGKIDVITQSPPCEHFSKMGDKEGIRVFVTDMAEHLPFDTITEDVHAGIIKAIASAGGVPKAIIDKVEAVEPLSDKNSKT